MPDAATVDTERFLARGREVLAKPPFSVMLGAELVALAPGRVELAISLRDELTQQHGFAHGGLLADNALTFAGGSALRVPVATSEYKINDLRPALGQRLVARARALHAGRSQAVCQCDVVSIDDGGGKLCAVAQGTIARLAESGADGAPREGAA